MVTPDVLREYGITLTKIEIPAGDINPPDQLYHMGRNEEEIATFEAFTGNGGIRWGNVSWPAAVTPDRMERMFSIIQDLFYGQVVKIARRGSTLSFDSSERYVGIDIVNSACKVRETGVNVTYGSSITPNDSLIRELFCLTAQQGMDSSDREKLAGAIASAASQIVS